MTLILECTMRNGKVVPLDAAKVEKWKASHKDGEVFDMILDDGSSSALTPLAKRFFATRDEYARMNGLTNEHAKIELKHNYGVVYPIGAPPVGRLTRMIVEEGVKELGDHLREIAYFTVRELQLSIVDYTHEELSRLVQGSEMALQEAST